MQEAGQSILLVFELRLPIYYANFKSTLDLLILTYLLHRFQVMAEYWSNFR